MFYNDPSFSSFYKTHSVSLHFSLPDKPLRPITQIVRTANLTSGCISSRPFLLSFPIQPGPYVVRNLRCNFYFGFFVFFVLMEDGHPSVVPHLHPLLWSSENEKLLRGRPTLLVSVVPTGIETRLQSVVPFTSRDIVRGRET